MQFLKKLLKSFGAGVKQVSESARGKSFPTRMGKYVLWKRDGKFMYYRHVTKNRKLKVAL